MTRRARYGTTALLYSTFAWMLLKRGDVEGAYKVLVEADEKNEHPVSEKNFKIENLLGFTNYDLYVRGVCGGQSGCLCYHTGRTPFFSNLRQ